MKIIVSRLEVAAETMVPPKRGVVVEVEVPVGREAIGVDVDVSVDDDVGVGKDVAMDGGKYPTAVPDE
jgi:hypothetical protein